MDTLRLFPIRRIRLMLVDRYGDWWDGFNPQLIMNICTYLPDLEEIIVDETRLPPRHPLPGTLVRC
jgi:hypothetical protein